MTAFRPESLLPPFWFAKDENGEIRYDRVIENSTVALVVSQFLKSNSIEKLIRLKAIRKMALGGGEIQQQWANEIKHSREYLLFLSRFLNEEPINSLFGNPSPPEKRKSISKVKRQLIWDRFFPKERYGRCECCSKNNIEITDFEVGHIKAFSQGGTDDLSNLIPLCSQCNKSMGTENFYDYKRRLTFS